MADVEDDYKAEESPLECRFYEDQYPEVESLVMVSVKQIADMGAYVALLEYGNIEGMILLSELSRRRIRSINKLIRVGKNEVVMVLRVDKEKGYIDLSKRRVSQEEIVGCEERYNKSKMTHSVLRHVAEQCNMPVKEVYERVAWPLYKLHKQHVYDSFRLAIQDPDGIFGKLENPLDAVAHKCLLDQIKRKLTPQPVKIRCDLEVTCFTYEGIDAIQAALMVAMDMTSDVVPIQIRLIAPPLYVMSSTTLDKVKGVALMAEAADAITAKIAESGGSCTIKMAPKVVSQKDEDEIAMMIKQVEKEQSKVDGDDDEDD